MLTSPALMVELLSAAGAEAEGAVIPTLIRVCKTTGFKLAARAMTSSTPSPPSGEAMTMPAMSSRSAA